MSAIPPNPIASVLQSPTAQTDAAREADAAKNADAQRARALSGGPDAILEVEGTDTDDTEVHTDAGGLGSKGREDAKPDEEETVAEEEAEIVIDEHGKPRIDLSA